MNLLNKGIFRQLAEKYNTENHYWISFYKGLNTGFYVEKAGYFDERPQVHTSVTQLLMLLVFPIALFFTAWALVLLPFLFFGWGKLYINLPIKTGIQDCDSAAWGVNYHDNMLWIYIGGGNMDGGKKWITFGMPWEMIWYRTSLLLKDEITWEHEYKGNQKDFYEDKWKDPELVFIRTYSYLDSYDNTPLLATIRVEQREWRYKWMPWTSLFSKIRTSIDIQFSEEVGNRKGSWKGGCIGCDYDLRPGESPLQCLKRMEKERKF